MAQANGSLRNRFAKRHYEAIATAIQEARRRASDGDNNHDPITNVVDELCWLFRSDNGQFKQDRFYRACEPGANVRARSWSRVNTTLN
jgi:hypothetical protein